MAQLIEGDDVLGYLEGDVEGDVEGDMEGDDVLGARPTRNRRRARVIRNKVAAGAFALKNRGFVDARETYLPIDSQTTIAAAASRTISVRPQGHFKSLAVNVPNSIAPSFTIDSISIANKLQGAVAGSISAEVFSNLTANGAGMRQEFDVCPMGLDIVIVVTNISAGALRFFAGFQGYYLVNSVEIFR